MILIYRAEDSTEERFDIDELSSIESEAIERVTGMDWDEIETELKAQRPGVMRAVLWSFRKRDDSGLQFSSFDVPGWKKRARVRLTAEEVTEYIGELDRQFPDEADHAQMVHMLRSVADDPADVDAAVNASAKAAVSGARPKGAARAASRRSARSTSGTSPTS